MAILKGGNGAIKSLGAMVGILIALYVFDMIISIILPLAYNCSQVTTVAKLPSGGAWTANTTGKVCYSTNDTGIVTAAIPSTFGSALTFIQSLFGVIGIIGVFEVIYRGLKRAGLL